MSKVQIRIPAGATDVILNEVRRWRGREGIVFAHVTLASVGGHILLLVRDPIVPPESAFLPSGSHGARWSGAWSIEMMKRSMQAQSGIAIFHFHANRGQVALSPDDLSSAGELLPRFQMVIPDQPHMSVVLGPDSAEAVVLLPGTDQTAIVQSVRLLTDRIATYPPPHEDRQLLDRRPLQVNAASLEILRAATVAVVGLSGGGSQVVPQLSRLNVGTVIGIDPQGVDGENLWASPYIPWFANQWNVKKTTLAKWLAWWANPKTRFVGIPHKVAESQALESLKRADVIVGCVNNLHAREDILRTAWRYCIPYVDIGARIVPEDQNDPHSEIIAVPGNVFTAIPGGPCPKCTDFLSDAKLAAETGGRGRSYLQGSDGGQAFVSQFNGVLANQAVCEVLHLLLGYSPPESRGAYIRYDGFRGTLEHVRVKRRANCPICQHELAKGDPIWNLQN